MVVVIAAQAIHMQRDSSRLRKAVQAMRQHLGAEVADLLAAQAQRDDGERPRRQVDHGARQRLVQRRVRVPEACEPC